MFVLTDTIHRLLDWNDFVVSLYDSSGQNVESMLNMYDTNMYQYENDNEIVTQPAN